MRLWPLTILQARFARAQSLALAQRWQKAARVEPDILTDLIELGGILEGADVDLVDGVPSIVTKDTFQLGVETGRRALALELMAAIGADTNDLIRHMEQEQ